MHLSRFSRLFKQSHGASPRSIGRPLAITSTRTSLHAQTSFHPSHFPRASFASSKDFDPNQISPEMLRSFQKKFSEPADEEHLAAMMSQDTTKTLREAFGKMEEAKQKFHSAILASEELLKKYPTSTKITTDMAVALAALGMVKEGLEVLKKVTSMVPKTDGQKSILKDALFIEGDLHAKVGEFQQTKDCLDRALQIDPSFLQATCLKAVAVEQLGNPEEAYEMLQKAKASLPEKNEQLETVRLLMAEMSMRAQRWEEAEEIIHESLRFNPNNQSAETMLSFARQKKRTE